MKFVRIPAGTVVRAGGDEPFPGFWLGVCEVSNAEYAQFDPRHDSRHESKHGYQFGQRGFPLNLPEQPVVRVSWEEAGRFCEWLSRRTGYRFDLPSEWQWEYACRAGSSDAFAFGPLNSDFSADANFADAALRRFVIDPYSEADAIDATVYDDWIPRDGRFDDGAVLTSAVGHYRANAWGLHDMHGNVWEWTRSDMADGSGRPGNKVVRGGSWYDRPQRGTASVRLAYRPYQRVFNVGFRVAMSREEVPSE